MRFGIFVALALGLSVPAFAQIPANAPITVVPTAKWAIEYGKWRCVLSRAGVANGKRALVSLTVEPITTTAWLRIGIEQTGVARDDDDDATLLVDGTAQPAKFHYNIFQRGPYQVREYMLDLKRDPIATVKDEFRLWTKRHGDVAVAANGFQAAWTATTKCMSDLYAKLGINEADLARITTPPEGDIFVGVDFPRGPISLDFGVLYWVATDRRIDDCRLLKPSGVATLDASMCSTMKARARMKPARDAAGQPMRAPVWDYVKLRTEEI